MKALQLDQLTSFIQFQSLLYNFKFPHIKYPINLHQYMWWRSILHKDAHICASNVHYVSNDQDKAFGLQILFLHVFTCYLQIFANICNIEMLKFGGALTLQGTTSPKVQKQVLIMSKP